MMTPSDKHGSVVMEQRIYASVVTIAAWISLAIKSETFPSHRN